MTGPNSFVHLEDVTKVYGTGPTAVHALRGVSLQLPEGSLTVVLGPSGSGKTTLLNLIGGLDLPTSGRIWVAGEDISSYTETQLTSYRRRRVGFIFQFFNLVASLTALENVELVAELAEDSADPDKLLERVGLAEHKNRFPDQLSGGEQQRVAIARALAKRPSLLLADEPTGSLDAETGVGVLALIKDVCVREGMTVIIVTHNVPIAAMADIVVYMHSGRVVQVKRNEKPVPPEQITW